VDILGIIPETKESESITMTYKITDSKGNKTPHALKTGYIQVSEFFPLSEVYLTYEYRFYVVKGFSMEGKRVRKEFDSLTQARTYLNSGI
jgi:hypothetical protein